MELRARHAQWLILLSASPLGCGGDNEAPSDNVVVDSASAETSSVADSDVQPTDTALQPDSPIADSADSATTATKLAYSLLGTHPQATKQTTADGKSLKELAAWNGKIYAGYGDWNANTGPIAINPFDPATGKFGATPLITVPTESIERLRVLGGKLYAPTIDPRAGESNGGYAWGELVGGVETWKTKLPVAAVHMLDMCTLNGTDLWMTGAVLASSTESDATIWRSVDGGATWTQSLRSPLGVIGRFYYCGVTAGSLYVNEFATSPSHRFNGTSWSDGPILPAKGGTAEPLTFNNKMVWTDGATHLQIFDGTTVTSAKDLPEAIRDIYIEGDKLYALGAAGRIDWTTDLVNWSGLPAASPSTDAGLSLAVLGGTFYVGRANAELYVAKPVP